MKKICMCFLILFIYADFSAYATADIDADATTSTCDYSVLNAYSGTVNMEEIWFPNNININWYDSNTKLNVDISSGVCEYDGAFNVPPAPTPPTGYVFTGWKIRPTMDFSTLAPGGSNALSQCGSERWSKGALNGAARCWYATTGADSETSCADSAFNDLKQQEWKIEFRSGTTTGMLYGSAYCSAKIGNTSNNTYPPNDSSNWLATYDTLESATGSDKRYCWCQATGWQPYSNNPNNTIYGPSSVSAPSVWVYFVDYGREGICNGSCVTRCSYHTICAPNTFRRALFVGGGN